MDAHHARWSELVVVGTTPADAPRAARAAAAAGRAVLIRVDGSDGPWMVTVDPHDDALCWLEAASG